MRGIPPIRKLYAVFADSIVEQPTALDYGCSIDQIFYNVDYADYLFSLPMGAGKTFLIAALIYLDLYFAQNEPDNPLFAHNFLVLVPSGLKSSILPSLRTIERFDPTWVLPEPAASKQLAARKDWRKINCLPYPTRKRTVTPGRACQAHQSCV